MPTEIKNAILFVTGAIVVFFVGYFVGKNLVPVVDVEKVAQEAKREMLNDFRQKLNSKIEEGLLPTFARYREIARGGEISLTSFTGEVLAIDIQNNALKVKVANRYEEGDFFNYLNEPNYYIKTVKIGEATKIVKQENKDRGEYLKEMEEYKKSGEEGSAPEPYIETELSRENLKEGQKVTVDAELEFKLEENKAIQAKKIIVGE